MRTFGELITGVGRYVGRPDTVYREHVKEAINLALLGFTRQFVTPSTRRRTTLLATGAQQQGLPADVDRPVWFMDKSNSRAIDAGLNWDRNYPNSFGNATGGYVFEWSPDGVHPTIEQPLGTYLTLESSASDARAVLFEGTVYDSASSGWGTHEYESRERAYLTGTTPVTLTVPFQNLREIAVASRLNNAVIVRSGTKAIAIIDRGDVAPAYPWVRWLRVPGAGTEILMEYIPKVPRLRDDDQGIPPFVPADYLYWHAIQQCAADLERPMLSQTANAKLGEVILNERQKQLAFGDNEWRGQPADDGWNDLDGTDVWL